MNIALYKRRDTGGFPKSGLIALYDFARTNFLNDTGNLSAATYWAATANLARSPVVDPFGNPGAVRITVTGAPTGIERFYQTTNFPTAIGQTLSFAVWVRGSLTNGGTLRGSYQGGSQVIANFTVTTAWKQVQAVITSAIGGNSPAFTFWVYPAPNGDSGVPIAGDWVEVALTQLNFGSALLPYEKTDAGQALSDRWSQGNHAQLGSTAGPDSNDPVWVVEGLSFDGVDDVINSPIAIPLAAHTILVAHTPLSTPTNRDIFSTNGITAPAILHSIEAGGLPKAHVFSGAGTSSIAGGRVIPSGTPIFTGQRNDGTVLSVLQDGRVAISVSQASGPTGTTSTSLIGNRAVSGAGNNYFYNAKHHYIAVYNRALSDAEIYKAYKVIRNTLRQKNVFMEVADALPAAPIVAYDFSRAGSGQLAYDTVGNLYPVQLGSTAGVDTNDPTWASNSLNFDGVDDRAVAAFTSPITFTACTAYIVFSAPLPSSDFSALMQVFNASGGGGNPRISLMLDGRLNLEMAGAVYKSVAANAPTYQKNAVTFAVVTRDTAGLVSGYVNGVLIGTASGATVTANDAWGQIQHGPRDFGAPYTAQSLYTSGLYARALTAAEVAAAYATLRTTMANRGVYFQITDSLPASPLLAYDFARTGSGQTVSDSAFNQYPLQLGSTTGVDSNDPTWQTNGLSFDGVDDKTYYPGTLPLSGDTDLTFMIVTALDPSINPTSNHVLGSIGNSASVTRGSLHIAGSAPGTVGYYFGTYGDDLTITSQKVEPNIPTFLAARYTSATKVLSGQIGASIKAQKTLSGPLALSATTTIGFGGYGGAAAIVGISGMKGHYAVVYNRALSDAEINTSYYAIRKGLKERGVFLETSDALPSTPLVAYDFGRAPQNQTVLDTVSASYTLQLGSTTGVDADDPAWATNSLNFDGVDDKAVLLGGLPALAGNVDMTILTVSAVDTSVNSAAPARMIQSLGAGGSGVIRANFTLGVKAGASPNYAIFCQNNDFNTSAVATSNAPTFTATRFASLTNTVSLNVGVGAAASFVLAGPLAIPNPANVTFGLNNDGTGYPVKASLYYSAVYNRKLSDAEVSAAYNTLRTTLANRGVYLVQLDSMPTGALMAQNFLEGSDQSVIDQTGNGRNLQLGSTTGTDSNDPTWSATGLNFDGVDDKAISATLPITGNVDFTFITVASVDTAVNPAAYKVVSVIGDVPGGVRAGAYCGVTSAVPPLWVAGPFSDDVLLEAATTNTPTFIAGRYVAATTTFTGRINTSASVSKVLAGPLAVPATAFASLGLNTTGLLPTKTTVYYHIVYPRALSDAEISTAYTQLKNYMAQRGVTI